MKAIYLTLAPFLFCFASYAASVDSVCVDSVWNSDSSWYDGNGILQYRTSRDCRITFVPQGSGVATCSLSVSIDSGNSWGPIPNPLQIVSNNSLSVPLQCGKKGFIIARVLGANRSNVVFKVTSSICNPLKITSPVSGQRFLVDDTVTVTWDKPIANPKVFYNDNLGHGWLAFSSISPISNLSGKVVLPLVIETDSLRIKVEDGSNTYSPGISDPFITKVILIANPVKNQKYAVGQTVLISWRYSDSRISSLRLMLSTDGGITYNDMLTGTLSPATASYSWVVGSEPGYSFTYPSSECVFKIEDYLIYSFDVSGVFTVSK